MFMNITTNEQLQQVIFDAMSTYVNQQNINQDNIKKAIEILEQIKNLFQVDSNAHPNKFLNSYYSSKKGFVERLYYIQHAADYPTVLKLINEFLDLVRGTPLELLVVEIDHDLDGNVTSIKTLKGKESEVEMQRKINKNSKNTVEYLKNNLKEQIEIDKKFLSHYQQFENIAKSHFQHKREGKQRYNFNEGHIIEAYQRHLIERYYDDDYDNRHITPKHVAIMLYYSINNTPWWQGGDVSNVQVKGKNYRLATELSIRQVANILIDLYQNPDKYTGERIHEIFSADKSKMMTLEELKKKKTSELEKFFDKSMKS